MKRKITISLGVFLIVALVWYVFIKKFDYQVNFKANANVGTVIQTIKTWSEGMGNATILQSHLSGQLLQEIRSGTHTHLYQWQVSRITDSTSQIRVFAKDKRHSLQNKVAIPFSDTPFEKETRKTVLSFSKRLQEHLRKFRVKIVGIDSLTSNLCAYVSVKTTQTKKAPGMIQTYPTLIHSLSDYNITLNGTPFIEITAWNEKNDSLAYDFCIPIKKMQPLPKDSKIKYKNVSAKKALKAIYNGNYITSDRAWYALLNYAKTNTIAIDRKPIEVFYDNPETGGYELDWKAEIYFPLKENDE